jgi:PGF-CTERM protein
MTGSRSAAVCIAAVVVLSTVVAGVTVVSAQDSGTAGTSDMATNGTGLDLPPADDAYVKGNGDVVLAYEDTSYEGRANFGLNVSKGLFHALIVTNQTGMTSAGMNNVTANATAILTPGKFTANGTLEVARPEALSNLSVNVTGKSTDENARSDAIISATIAPTNARFVRTVPVKSARTAGNVTIAASNFSAAAEAHATLSRPLGQPQHQEFRITEKKDAYTLSASQEYTVSSFAAKQWNTRRQAKQTLRQRYVSLAKSLGGTADLKLESYSFTQQRRGYKLDIEYTVTYHGIERVLTNQLVTRLSTSEKVTLNQSETDAITQQLRNLTVREAYVSYDQQGRSIDAAVRVDLGNYDDVVSAALTIGQSVNMKSFERPPQFNVSKSLERFEKQFEARQAANLTQRYTFAANVSKKSARAITVNAEFHSRTANWGQYVQELKDRGINPPNLHYELHATTEGKRINVTAAVEVSKENLLRQASGWLLNASDSSETNRAHKYIKAFRKAGFQKARTDFSLHDGRVRLEAGAAFKNMTTLRDALATTEQGRNLQSIVGRTENGTVMGYVRLNGAVPANATKEDVRALSNVNGDTAIHMPNSWNKSFSTTNATRAKSYLGLSGSASSLVGPGFGIVVAVVALLAAALVVVRRRH